MKRFFIILNLVVLAIAVKILFFTNYACVSRNSNVSQRWNGVVVDKYVDTFQHRAKVVLLLQPDSDKYMIDRLNEDRSLFYQSVKKGDSVRKEENSLEVYVYRYDGYRRFVLDYDCR